MNPRDQTVIIVAVAIIFVLLAFYPFDGVASFDPLGWVINSVNGFFDWIFNLFFGWIK